MVKLASLVALLYVSMATGAAAVQDTASDATSLKSAVAEFNRTASANPVGKTQLALTEAEVVAAIRGWIPENTPGVTADVFEQFQEIAESQTLPDGAELSSCTGWTGYRGYQFQVWWIDLSIKTGENSGYTFRIRDQKISSRKMSQEELAEDKQ
ncbi:hypothetical protein [uncultured Rubinisphaera sp.]|uniref:hypothetical protein n=1 Tax=uncultured Rubinisphaera sp. TaxID=1678686 RepID=UPI000EC09C1D|nr:hypothetical protein [Planctomycetaceae bacterium]